MSNIRWTGEIPSTPRLGAQILSVPPTKSDPKKSIFVRFLAGYEGVWLHWHPERKRSLPCLAKKCPWCEEHFQLKRKGYAPVLAKLMTRLTEEETLKNKCATKWDWKPAVLELTSTIIEVVNEYKPLRGWIAEVSRPGHKNNAPLKITFLEQPNDPNLPEPFDVKPILERAWGLHYVCSRSSDNAPKPTSPKNTNGMIIPFRQQA